MFYHTKLVRTPAVYNRDDMSVLLSGYAFPVTQLPQPSDLVCRFLQEVRDPVWLIFLDALPGEYAAAYLCAFSQPEHEVFSHHLNSAIRSSVHVGSQARLALNLNSVIRQFSNV